MRLKPFKKEKLNNKQKKILIALSSLCFIFLFIAIYQSFAAYNIKHSETFINAKVGSLHDIRIIGIYINNVVQPNTTEFPTSGAFFDRVRCYVNGEFQESITGEWIDNNLTIKGFKGKTDCNVYFIRGIRPSSFILSEAITLDNGGLTAIRNRTTNPATAPDFNRAAVSQRLFNTIPIAGGAISNHDGKHNTSINYAARSNYQPHAPGDVLFATRANAYTGGGAGGLENSQHDPFGESLYFRGDVRNNFVQFAGFWWKILRIEGNGNIRLIYNGVVSEDNPPLWLGASIGQSPFNQVETDSRHVGFKHGTTCATYATCHANTTNSTVLNNLNNWYTNNIVNKGTTVTSRIATNTIFCGDRNLALGTGIGTNETFYGAAHRMNFTPGWIASATTFRPSLQCINRQSAIPNNHDQFGTPGNGNGALTHPIGLITSDEVVMAGIIRNWIGAGSAPNAIPNADGWLYTSRTYWTMSPAYSRASNLSSMFRIFGDGFISGIGAVSNDHIYPVISIRSDTQIISGNGTRENPYIIQ